MEVFESAKVTFNHGVGNDSRGLKRNHRQLTILSLEGWNAALNDLDKHLPWTIRRANLLVEGIDLKDTKGEVLKIGDVLVEITGELVPCNRMDEQAMGLTDALNPDWRGGVTCKILTEGFVSENDTIAFMDKD